jgi:hypothetical protein
MQGWVPSFGFSATAVTTVSIFMMLAEPNWSSQALICSSMELALASIKILTFIGLGILITRPFYKFREPHRTASYSTTSSLTFATPFPTIPNALAAEYDTSTTRPAT